MELNSKDFFGAQNGAIGHNIMSAQRLVAILVPLSDKGLIPQCCHYLEIVSVKEANMTYL